MKTDTAISYTLSSIEYETAVQRFFGAGVKALMEAQGGVYSLVSKESMEHLPDYSITTPHDDMLRGRPIEAISEVQISRESVIDGDLDSILASMNSVAVEMASQISTAILTHIVEISKSVGNVANEELSYGAIADTLEDLDISFDNAGNPNFSFVTSPEGQGACKVRDRMRA